MLLQAWAEREVAPKAKNEAASAARSIQFAFFTMVYLALMAAWSRSGLKMA